MDLKIKSSTSNYHHGYGAGSGTIDTTIYYCPCGKGEILRVKDNIPGFRDTDWRLNCHECIEKYNISNFDGELTPRIELTEYHLKFLKKLTKGGYLTHDFLGDEINHMYKDEEKDVEAKKQCEAMASEDYIVERGDGYEITEKGKKELRKRNLLR